ncbi:domain of Kin17 curved DNA-binding protein-domain-containing protein [Podospora didyma]|uniref:Domain of Kin17 curved DNA-binding protein-domain-containing protein n=1 Tax=Podospora didyma TaxID=330526 RepID=A0AAE0K659_9PEZI|nr:domain of Kin17 curved DNA-binding protein-domain-containing protein [Podospora didyma]
MPKAEIGSTKHLSNQMKSRGLTRLRWYCQICEKPCRDENGFKMHTQSPSHMAKALEAGKNFKSVQEDFSKQFEDYFISLLRTSHGTKEISLNKFYQEVIARKDHVHLNATRWHSLTEFGKHLGRSSLCHVEEKEDGLFISYLDNSPEAMKRREAIRRKELQDKGDEERELMLLKSQIKRAQQDAAARGIALDELDDTSGHELKRGDGEKIKLSFGAKPKPAAAAEAALTPPSKSTSPPAEADIPDTGADSAVVELVTETLETEAGKPAEAAPAPKPISMAFGAKPQSKNVFKNAFSGGKKKVMAAPPKKMSEAERIMKEEIKQKRAREEKGGPPNKRPRF